MLMPLKVDFKHNTNMCESVFKLKIPIDHIVRVSNTLVPKLLIKQINTTNLKSYY